MMMDSLKGSNNSVSENNFSGMNSSRYFFLSYFFLANLWQRYVFSLEIRKAAESTKVDRNRQNLQTNVVKIYNRCILLVSRKTQKSIG